jgi:hypothetical protein
MKKIYIQEIEKNGQDLNQPGPDKYEPPQTFGKKGIHYTMRPDISRQESKYKSFMNYCTTVNSIIKKKGMLPGPGSYHELEVVGNTRSTRLTS